MPCFLAKDATVGRLEEARVPSDWESSREPPESFTSQGALLPQMSSLPFLGRSQSTSCLRHFANRGPF